MATSGTLRVSSWLACCSDAGLDEKACSGRWGGSFLGILRDVFASWKAAAWNGWWYLRRPHGEHGLSASGLAGRPPFACSWTPSPPAKHFHTASDHALAGPGRHPGRVSQPKSTQTDSDAPQPRPRVSANINIHPPTLHYINASSRLCHPTSEPSAHPLFKTVSTPETQGYTCTQSPRDPMSGFLEKLRGADFTGLNRLVDQLSPSNKKLNL
jgi:hypothetical protein